jgi:hypothetical protein
MHKLSYKVTPFSKHPNIPQTATLHNTVVQLHAICVMMIPKTVTSPVTDNSLAVMTHVLKLMLKCLDQTYNLSNIWAEC